MTIGNAGIALICDDNYLEYCVFLIDTLVRKNSDLPQIYVLTDNIDPDRFVSRMSKFPKVIQVNLDLDLIRSLGAVHQGHVAISTYGKLLLGDLLPPHVSKCIYLDIDIYISGSLNPLLNFQLNRPIAGTQFANGESRLLFGSDNHTYFSAGVLIADLNFWRSQEVSNGLIQTLNRFPKMRYQDADILNIYFKDNWQPLPISFNYMADVALNAHLYDSKIEPLIVHFPGKNKPWTSKGHTYWHRVWRSEFNEFADFKLKRIVADTKVNRFLSLLGQTNLGRVLKLLISRKMKDKYLNYQERFKD